MRKRVRLIVWSLTLVFALTGVRGAIGGDDTTFDLAVGQAIASYQRGDDAQALDHFRALVSAAPDGSFAPKLRLYIADLSYRQGDVEGARAELNGIIKSGSALRWRLRAQLGLGWIELFVNNFSQAEGQFRAVQIAAPGTEVAAHAALGLGWTLLAADNPTGAVTAFQTVAASDASSGDLALTARLFEGLARARANDFVGASSVLEQALAEAGVSKLRDDFERDIGWCKRLGGNETQAVAQFEHVVAAYSETAYAGSEDPAWENPYTKPIDQLLGAVTNQYLAMERRNSPSGPTLALLVLADRRAALDAAAALE